MSGRRGPVERLVDLAVAVPTCSLVAAKRAVPLVARVGTLGAGRLVGRVSEAVHDLRHEDAAAEPSDEPHPDPSTEDEVAATETVSIDELPIEGYDDLAARQVVDRLAALGHADLARIETYEREHRNRSTVLGKISMLIA